MNIRCYLFRYDDIEQMHWYTVTEDGKFALLCWMIMPEATLHWPLKPVIPIVKDRFDELGSHVTRLD